MEQEEKEQSEKRIIWTEFEVVLVGKKGKEAEG